MCRIHVPNTLVSSLCVLFTSLNFAVCSNNSYFGKAFTLECPQCRGAFCYTDLQPIKCFAVKCDSVLTKRVRDEESNDETEPKSEPKIARLVESTVAIDK